jgi:hypothetical protein
MQANQESAAEAVQTLQAELNLVFGVLNGLDQKAGLIPAIVGTVALLVVAPDTRFNSAQAIFLCVAVASGILAGGLAVRVLWARNLNIGPDADRTVQSANLPVGEFDIAVADSLARSVNSVGEVVRWKETWLNRAMFFGAVAILALVLARIAGGLPVQDPTPTPSPSTVNTCPPAQPTSVGLEG